MTDGPIPSSELSPGEERPLISVVIPTFNYGRFVEEAVDSVLAQTYDHLEVIVVDDGSEDDTRSRLERYGSAITCIHQANQGMSTARNTGIGNARGDWIAFLDSDDVWHPRKLEIQVAFLRENPHIDLLATGHAYGVEGDWRLAELPARLPFRRISADDLLIGSRFGTCGVLVRKGCFAEVGLFNTRLRAAEDVEMWIRIARRFSVGVIDMPLWRYRLHGNNTHQNVELMDANVARKLDILFGGETPLSRSFVARLRAGSVAAYFSAYGHLNAGRWGDAFSRSLRAVRLWPLPLPGDLTGSPLAHHRLLLRLLALRLGWKPKT
jgi:glycosyltransferase involved in cell wall biosynthesis